jgi:catechol 2,3-dioxygenase-like lactoylglutathione lyase family enzyme
MITGPDHMVRTVNVTEAAAGFHPTTSVYFSDPDGNLIEITRSDAA